jgi:phage major head subunit gpT-like protein
MAVSQEKINLLSTGFKAIFAKTFNDTAAPLMDIATLVKSTNLQENYAWIGQIPDMQEWVGDRTVKELKDFNYTLANKPYEATVKVPSYNIEYDNAGVFAPAIAAMAEKAKKQGGKLVAQLLKDGTTKNGYDGVPFFGDHTVGAGTVSNKSAGALTGDNLLAAYAFMMGMQNDNGEAMGITPTLLVVGPSLFATAKKLVDTQTAEGNPTFGLVKFVVEPTIVGNAWYLMDTSKIIKPFIVQVAKDGKLETDTTQLFQTNHIHYGASWFGNAGYGLWQLAYMGGTA